jgi:hypothetical protein
MSCWSDAAEVAHCVIDRFITVSMIDVDSGMYRG